MKTLFAEVLFGVLLYLNTGFAQSASLPDPVFRTGFENSTCSNNILEDGEQCDDGDSDGGDGCSATCQVEPGYQCVGLPSTCEAICGDGLIVVPETCDQGFGNVGDADGCSSSCQQEPGYVCTGLPSICVPL